jgi:hypothetical protein
LGRWAGDAAGHARVGDKEAVVTRGKEAVAIHDKKKAVSPAGDKEESASGVKDYYLMLTNKLIVMLIAENINKMLLKF